VIVADVVDDDGRGVLMEPVVDGAAGDYIGQRQVDATSAAGRAALADPAPPPSPPPAPPTGGGPSARRRPLRLLLGAGILLAVLVAGAIGTYVWALQHWFVGVDEQEGRQQVAVFRGLDVSLLGLDLYRLDQDAELPVTDLTPAARNRVQGGITADDAADADRIVSALRDQRLPACRTAEEEAAEEAAPTTAPAPETTVAPPDGAVPTVPGEVPPAPAPEATAAPAPTPAAPTTPESTPDAGTSAATTPSSRPGVDCREAE
jgi:PPM family protein phosphatase